MPIQHDIALGLIDIAKSAIGLGSVAIPALVVALKVRARQNRNFAVNIIRALDEKVKQLADQVKHIENGQKITQDLTVIHSDRLKEGNQMMASLTSKISEIEERLPQVQDVMEKVFSFLRSQKRAAALEEKPLKGGMTALKERKDSDDKT